MIVQGDELFIALASGQIPELKLVFNAAGAIFCRGDQQHRDQKAPGVSYEDDYAGNALAAVVTPG